VISTNLFWVVNHLTKIDDLVVVEECDAVRNDRSTLNSNPDSGSARWVKVRKIWMYSPPIGLEREILKKNEEGKL
jgi:hypothetical protein